jgi:hypothetical protein
MDQLARPVIEDERRSREVECAFVEPARSAEALDGRSNQSALRAKRWRHGLQPRPAVGTGRAPSPLSHRQPAQYARNRKEKIQDRVDDHAFPPACSTQRAGTIYDKGYRGNKKA